MERSLFVFQFLLTFWDFEMPKNQVSFRSEIVLLAYKDELSDVEGVRLI
jgi:hypothetical protein